MSEQSWVSVRHVLQIAGTEPGFWYEERITTWLADDMDAAIALAEAEVEEYCEILDYVSTGLFQAFWMADDPGPMISGVETFSLIRESDLPADEYIDRYFDTGHERQQPSASDDHQ